jgi:hypothetical protein
LGKVIPADDSEKLTDFVTNKYDAFTEIYDACKDQSEKITDVKTVESDEGSLSVKLSTDKGTLSSIKDSTVGNDSITINNDVITAKL